VKTEIRAARPEEKDRVWDIFSRVIAAGESYVFEPDSAIDVFETGWWGYDPFVAVIDREVAGTFILRPNYRGLGSHVANAGFMVHPDFQGRGVGRAMGTACLREARKQGYASMQFNMVVSTNEPAVRLWKSLGFQISGTLPKVFRHSRFGLVDAYVMNRDLSDIELGGKEG
jgi:GNAT superfamily N-acetyltransferase